MSDLRREIEDGAGEVRRRELGIDGTAGDAQDVRHELYQPQRLAVCLVCGLSPTASIHS